MSFTHFILKEKRWNVIPFSNQITCIIEELRVAFTVNERLKGLNHGWLIWIRGERLSETSFVAEEIASITVFKFCASVFFFFFFWRKAFLCILVWANLEFVFLCILTLINERGWVYNLTAAEYFFLKTIITVIQMELKREPEK